MTCFVKMKYTIFHRSTRARRQKCNNLLTEANSLNRTSRIYIHDSNDLSEETVKLKLCGRLHKKHSYNWSTSPIGPVISGVPFTCACPYAVTLVNHGQPHMSRSAACEFPAQTEQNQHKQRVNRIFRGWIWRERERERVRMLLGVRQGRGAGQNWWGTLVLSALPGGPRWIKINYPGLSINHQEWAGQEEGGNGRRWVKIREIYGGSEWAVSSRKLWAGVQETKGKSKSPFTCLLIIYVFRLLWKS